GLAPSTNVFQLSGGGGGVSVGQQWRGDRSASVLCARRERPRGSHGTAEQRDELAPLHHSITSSAMASSVGGASSAECLGSIELIRSKPRIGSPHPSHIGPRIVTHHQVVYRFGPLLPWSRKIAVAVYHKPRPSVELLVLQMASREIGSQ